MLGQWQLRWETGQTLKEPIRLQVVLCDDDDDEYGKSGKKERRNKEWKQEGGEGPPSHRG